MVEEACRNVGADESNVADGGVAGLAEQSKVGSRKIIDEEPGDRMPLAVEAAGEEDSGPGSDRHESARAVPQAARPPELAQVDVVGERVVGIQVEQHQLQLMCVVDRGAVFGLQERACAA